MTNSAPLNTDLLRSKLKLKNLQAENLLRDHHGPAVSLMDSLGVPPGSLRAHAKRLLTATAATAALLTNPIQNYPVQASLPAASEQVTVSPYDLRTSLIDQLNSILPLEVGFLTPDQEYKITTALHSLYGLHASAELEGNRLNHSYGLIGAEQHLPRFPGDTVEQHDAIQKSGITPGRGAWGYFKYSKSELTEEDIQKEKYYFAVQTLYLSDWNTNLAYLRDWYKHRKMIAVNPKNGKLIVGVVADSGPAAWTGKHFGGSPEIMAYLGLNVGKQKGPVIMYFVDDPENKIPLGPLEYNIEAKPLLSLNPKS